MSVVTAVTVREDWPTASVARGDYHRLSEPPYHTTVVFERELLAAGGMRESQTYQTTAV